MLSGRQYPIDVLARLWLARHVQRQSRIKRMRRICSFTDYFNCIMIYLRLLGAMIITDFLLQEAIHSLRKQSHFSKSKDKASCSEKFLKYKPIFP